MQVEVISIWSAGRSQRNAPALYLIALRIGLSESRFAGFGSMLQSFNLKIRSAQAWATLESGAVLPGIVAQPAFSTNELRS